MSSLRCEQRKWAVAIGVVLFVAVSAASFGASDPIYLKYEGISGESTDRAHEGWIEIMSFSWGVSKPASFGVSQGASARFNDIQVTKRMDSASPKLFLACASGQQTTTAILQGTRVILGGLAPMTVVYFQITLTNVVVSSISPGNMATSGTYPTESLSLNFGKIQWTYRLYGPTGQLVDTITTSWDLLANRPAAAKPELMKLE